MQSDGLCRPVRQRRATGMSPTSSVTRTGAAARRVAVQLIIETRGERLKERLHVSSLPARRARHYGSDRPFHRPDTARGHACASTRDAKHHPAAVRRVGGTSQQALGLEPLEQAGQGARMEVQGRGELSTRYPWIQVNQPQDQPLRSRHPCARTHLL